MSPPPVWKCPKQFKFSLGEPWEIEGSNDRDTHTDEVVLHKEITEIRKNHAETGTNFNNETKQQGTNWNNETLLDEIKTHNHYQ